MIINYDRYKQLVPKETLEVTQNFLKYLDHYKNDKLMTTDGEWFGERHNKYFLILLHLLSRIEEYNTFFCKYNFDDSKLKFDPIKLNKDVLIKKYNDETEQLVYSNKTNEEGIDYSKLFSTFSSYFLIFNNEIDYINMTPLDLLINAANIYDKNSEDYSLFRFVFGLNGDFSSFKKKLNNFNDRIKMSKQEEQEKEELNGFSPKVKSFLKTASSIRTDLINNKKDFSLCNNVEKDSIPLSLLLALRDYDDLEKDENGLTTKDIINRVFEKNGLHDNYSKYVFPYDRKECSSSIYIIKEYFKKYYEQGIYEGKFIKDVTVQGIIENVLNHDLNDTLVIDRLMKTYECNPKTFKDFTSLVEKEYEKAVIEKEDDYTSSLYKYLRRDTKEYLELSTKIYLLIKEKMNKKEHNRNVLEKEDDLDTLSLFIASYYLDLDVAKFYKSYGITLDKIFEFLNLSITEEEIEDIPLNKKTLVDKYDRFVRTGVNSNTDIKNVTPTLLNHNLCNREFNRSTIMEDIFYGITSNVEIKTDFLEQLKETLKQKEKERKLDNYNKLFKDMDIDAKKYFHKLANVYDKMSKNCSKIDDVKTLSVILATYNSTDSNSIRNILLKNGFNYQYLADKLINEYYTKKAIFYDDNNYFSLKDFDVDLLLKEFKDLIFDENGNKRNMIDIIKYIPKFCNPITLNEIMAELKISNDIFSNIDELIEKQKEIDRLEGIENKAKDKFDICYDGKIILKEAIRTIEYLRSINFDKVKEYDLPELSILLAFLNTPYKQYFESNGLTLEKVCEVLNIKKDDLLSSQLKEINYNSHINDFKKYLKPLKYECPSFIDFKNIFFEDNGALDYVIELLNSKYHDFVIDDNVLKTEVVNNAPYIDSISLDDRIELLDKHQIESINIEAMESVLSFGNSLSVHSKYIYDELPRLSSSDKYESSIENINELISKVYDRKERKSVFKRLFSTKDNKVEINLDALKELRENIDENIRVLSEELKSYDSIRQYLEAYRKKNREYLNRSNDKVDEITKELETLNPDDDDDFDRLIYLKSLLQIMKDKVNRFSTTNIIARQDLLRISQAIVNHFITINALEMAKNDLFPLIGGELAISKGRESEKYSLELSKNVMDLFQALLTGNIAGTKEHLELIRNSQIPLDLVETINEDIDNYIESVKVLKKNIPTLNIQNKKSEE